MQNGGHFMSASMCLKLKCDSDWVMQNNIDVHHKNMIGNMSQVYLPGKFLIIYLVSIKCYHWSCSSNYYICFRN